MQPFSKLKLFPGHEGRMNHIGDPIPADRTDCEIHFIQPKCVRRDLLEWKTFRCQLLEREFAGLIAMAACALDGDEFQCDFSDWKVGKLRHFALNDHCPGLALE